MNAPEFIDMVRKMRDAQRQYFAQRDDQVLHRAKALEREVDKALLEMDGGPSLFTQPPPAEGPAR